MKKLVLLLIPVLIISCNKNTSDQVIPSAETPTSFPARLNSPFGVLVASVPDADKIIAAKSLGVNYVRSEITLDNFTQTLPYTDSLSGNGFKVITNFDYYSPDAGSMPFISNTAALTTGISSVLKTFQPYLVAVENEEVNVNYHSGSVQTYINELAAATQFLHTKNIKVTNGGLTEEVLCILVYRDYLNRGLTAQANNFAQRTMPPAIISALPSLSNYPQLANRVLAADTLVHAYKNMNFDYINFHWYEPVIQRWQDASYTSANTQHADTQALGEVMTYLSAATGKTPVSNEAGELYNSPGIVQDMMQQFRSAGTPYVIWYSGDGKGKKDDPVALNNSNGSLRANGQAFLNFLQNNYQPLSSAGQ